MTKGSSIWETENTGGDIDMMQVSYYLQEFDASLAKSGALCAMVTNGISAGSEVINIFDNGTLNDQLNGVGICKYKSPTLFEFIVDSVTYQFDSHGNGTYESSDGWHLLLAIAQTNLSSSGNVAQSSSKTKITRGNDGSYTTDVSYGTDTNVWVENLNARDEFAVSALKELLAHVSNPAEMSDNEMNFYCNAAYRWAANMMSVSANSRGTLENTKTETPEVTTRADIPTASLSTNTEKIFNNMLSTFERTDAVETISGKAVYSKRVLVQFKELMNFLNTYVKDDSVTGKTLGLKDLIDAIKAGGGGSSTMSGELALSSKGLGGDEDNPLHITGGFPSRQSLIAVTSDKVNSLPVFNAAGAIAYATAVEVKKKLLGWMSDYSSMNTFYTSGDSDSLESKVKATIDKRVEELTPTITQLIDTRVKLWLQQTTIVQNGDRYQLKFPSSI